MMIFAQSTVKQLAKVGQYEINRIEVVLLFRTGMRLG
jgi:hypothetical protein